MVQPRRATLCDDGTEYFGNMWLWTGGVPRGELIGPAVWLQMSGTGLCEWRWELWTYAAVRGRCVVAGHADTREAALAAGKVEWVKAMLGGAP